MKRLACTIHLFLLRLRHDQAGQTSAEYALVLLGAATIALLVALWARDTDQIGDLLDAMFGRIKKMVTD